MNSWLQYANFLII